MVRLKERSGWSWYIDRSFLQSFTNGWYSTWCQTGPESKRKSKMFEGRISRVRVLPFGILYVTVQTREIEHRQEGSFSRTYEAVKPRSLFIPLSRYYGTKSGSTFMLDGKGKLCRQWLFWKATKIRPWDYDALTEGCMP